MHKSCISRLICIYISVDWCKQKTASLYTYQSTYAIRKRHLYIHISRLMQSENGILLLFYIFLIKPWKWKKKKWKRGVGCKKGGMLCPVHKYLCILRLFFPVYFYPHRISLTVLVKCVFWKKATWFKFGIYKWRIL